MVQERALGSRGCDLGCVPKVEVPEPMGTEFKKEVTRGLAKTNTNSEFPRCSVAVAVGQHRFDDDASGFLGKMAVAQFG